LHWGFRVWHVRVIQSRIAEHDLIVFVAIQLQLR
jgi:hypothetical protein